MTRSFLMIFGRAPRGAVLYRRVRGPNRKCVRRGVALDLSGVQKNIVAARGICGVGITFALQADSCVARVRKA
jgi:hypothetical protein